jgi:hypothetical protein
VTPPPRIVGLDIHPWAVREAAGYRTFGLAATTQQRDIATVTFPRPRGHPGRVCLNELTETAREPLLARLASARRTAIACW